MEAVERKYQVKLSNAEDDFKYKLKERELEFDQLMNRKNGVSYFFVSSDVVLSTSTCSYL